MIAKIYQRGLAWKEEGGRVRKERKEGRREEGKERREGKRVVSEANIGK